MITGINADHGLYPIDKMKAHVDGAFHLAVSIFLINERGELLLQRRASGKYHSGGLWANSCCSHPLFGESLEACAHRRLKEELGLEVDLKEINQIDYKCKVGDLVENERVTWYRGFLHSKETINFNKEEVAEVRWISMKELEMEFATKPNSFGGWLKEYLAVGLANLLV